MPRTGLAGFVGLIALSPSPIAAAVPDHGPYTAVLPAWFSDNYVSLLPGDRAGGECGALTPCENTTPNICECRSSRLAY